MVLWNEKVSHRVFGQGVVVDQNDEKLTIQFSDRYGIKQFIYPDAFQRYLKLLNDDLESSVLKELDDKKKQIEAERLMKKQKREQEENDRRMALKKAKDDSQKGTGRVSQRPWCSRRNSMAAFIFHNNEQNRRPEGFRLFYSDLERFKNRLRLAVDILYVLPRKSLCIAIL